MRKVDIDDSFWNTESPSFYEWKMSIGNDEDKKKQANVVVREVSNLRQLTKSQENKDRLHDFNEWIRETYK